MATTYQDGDRISISKLDTRVLTALLLGPMSGYEIGQQCRRDSQATDSMSYGSLHYSIKSLLLFGFIDKVDSPSARSGYVYRINSLGSKVLGLELDRMKRLIKLASDRHKFS